MAPGSMGTENPASHAAFKESYEAPRPEAARFALLGLTDAHGLALEASHLDVEELQGIATDHGLRQIGGWARWKKGRKVSCRR